MHATILIAASLMGQYFGISLPYYPWGYAGYSAYGYGWGYGTFPYPMILPGTNPIQYDALYEGMGQYSFPVTYVAPYPKILEVVHSATPGSSSLHETRAETREVTPRVRGETGEVVAVDQKQHKIRLKLPAETVDIVYGPQTIWAAADGAFPEVKVGSIITVEDDKITVVKR